MARNDKKKTKSKFNSDDLAREMKKRFPHLTIRDGREYVICAFKTIADLVEQGETVGIYGFGRFYLDRKKGRVYNLRGKEYEKEDRYTMRFQQAKVIKNKLEEEEEYED